MLFMRSYSTETAAAEPRLQIGSSAIEGGSGVQGGV